MKSPFRPLEMQVAKSEVRWVAYSGGYKEKKREEKIMESYQCLNL